jgi:multicomponent Na+:H+ antiporter subunit C
MIMEIAVVVFFLAIAFSPGDVPPIGADLAQLEQVADPLPQALVITAIIIGAAVNAITVVMFISLHKRHKITDWESGKHRESPLEIL